MSQTPLLDQITQALQIRRQVAPSFLSKRNVVACGVGFKITGSQITTTPSVIVSVMQKETTQALSSDDMIPPSVGNVLTDVIESGEIIAHSLDRRLMMRPARPGVSISHGAGATGTLGCLVHKGTQIFIMSNNHILANLNQGQPGDLIIQPGLADGGNPTDAIAQLNTFIPIRFSIPVAATSVQATGVATPTASELEGCANILAVLFKSMAQNASAISQPRPVGASPSPQLDNQFDVALASLTDATLADANIVDLGSPPHGLIDPVLGLKVIKSGRTSGISEATITQIDVTVDVRYGDQVARFSNQMITTPFSQPGDSGSLVLDFDRNAVGLLFSGSETISVVTPLRPILNVLGVELVLG